MANVSVTHTFTNSTTADATQVNTNFTDIINGTSDGSKDFSISALTCAGNFTANGTTNTLGSASNDDLVINASLASSVAIKTTFSYDVGAATLGLRYLFLGSSDSAARSTKLAGATVASSYTFTLPTTGGTANYLLATDGSGTTSWVNPDLGVRCDGRLTLTTGTPVTTSDVTAATTLYFAPYKGGYIDLYNGTKWIRYLFTELSISVPATTATMYDVFVYDNSGTPTLELTAWTDDTNRATALTTQNGVYVKTGATTRRYVGSFRTTGSSGQTEDSLAKRYVWNYYNRLSRPMKVIEGTNTWTYTLSAFQQANASTANQLDMVIGVSEDLIEATVCGVASHSATSVDAIVGIGLGSATVNSATIFTTQKTNTSKSANSAHYKGFPGAGRRYLVWLEYSEATGTTTWYGDAGAVTHQSGIHGTIVG